jgi:U3 small nucleolar RNA-associated protein 13
VSRVDPTSTYLASGSADGVVKVWDIRKGYVTHVFRGHGGVVSALAFSYPRDASSVVETTDARMMRLVTGSVDTKVRIFELSSEAARASTSGERSRPGAVLDGHVSVPRGLDVSSDGRWLLSGGRDSVVLLWDLVSEESDGKKAKGKGKDKAFSPRLVKTIPVLERVEAVGLIHHDENISSSSASDGFGGLRFYIAGEKGVVSIWDCQKGAPLFSLGKEKSGDEEETRQILDAL